MKLINKFRRYIFFVITIVLFLGSIVQYSIYRYSIHRTTDDVLREYRTDIENYVEIENNLPSLSSIEFKHSYLRTMSKEAFYNELIDEAIYDSLIFSAYEGEPVVYRVLNFPVSTPDEDYIVTLALPTLEQEELIFGVIISSIALFLFFITGTLLAVRYMQRVMTPFYEILDIMRCYDLHKNKISQNKIYTDIDEFKELSKGLHNMMERIQKDYVSLKELVENTSHELQTPISVILMKIEQLQQQCSGDKLLMEKIEVIQSSLRRMSNYNRSLMLIARISSDHFYKQEFIDITNLCVNYIEEHEDVISIKNIIINSDINNHFKISIHPILAEFLVNNLFVNAIKYNIEGGYITINTDSDYLTIKNTHWNEIPEGNLFKRYVRMKDDLQSTGLGLQIVYEICQKNNLDITYSLSEEYFEIKITREKAS